MMTADSLLNRACKKEIDKDRIGAEKYLRAAVTRDISENNGTNTAATATLPRASAA